MSNVVKLRKKVGLTQRQLADLVGVTETTIRNLERSRHGMEQIERIVRLCEALKCSPEDLIAPDLPDAIAPHPTEDRSNRIAKNAR